MNRLQRYLRNIWERLTGRIRNSRKRNAVEAALQESEERFRSALAAMHEGLILLSCEGQVLMCNQRAEEILGVTVGQQIQYSGSASRCRILHEDGTEFPRETWPAFLALNEGSCGQDVIMGIDRPHKTLLWISVNAAPLLRRGETKPYAAVITFTDITDRKWFEEQIAQQIAAVNETHIQMELQANELLHMNAKLEQANAQLELLATRDGLTGLNNHRAFQDRIRLEFSRSRRYASPLALLLLDVDQFKSYNDTFGHPAGDEALKRVAAVLESTSRTPDFVARYGGEEFVLILPGTDAAGAQEVAERIRTNIARQEWEHREITVSIGVTSLHPATESIAALIQEADTALYRSKHLGRNRTTAYSLALNAPQALS